MSRHFFGPSGHDSIAEERRKEAWECLSPFEKAALVQKERLRIAYRLCTCWCDAVIGAIILAVILLILI